MLHANNFPEMDDDPEFLNLAILGASVEGGVYSDIGHYTLLFVEEIVGAICDKIICEFGCKKNGAHKIMLR